MTSTRIIGVLAGLLLAGSFASGAHAQTWSQPTDANYWRAVDRANDPAYQAARQSGWNQGGWNQYGQNGYSNQYRPGSYQYQYQYQYSYQYAPSYGYSYGYQPSYSYNTYPSYGYSNYGYYPSSQYGYLTNY